MRKSSSGVSADGTPRTFLLAADGDASARRWMNAIAEAAGTPAPGAAPAIAEEAEEAPAPAPAAERPKRQAPPPQQGPPMSQDPVLVEVARDDSNVRRPSEAVAEVRLERGGGGRVEGIVHGRCG